MNEIRRLRQNFDHYTAEWRSHHFLRKIAEKHVLNIDGVTITEWIPKGITSEFDYTTAYGNAIKKNQAVFGDNPKKIEIARFTKTEDYNRYLHIHNPRITPKIRGDGKEGFGFGNKIALIDYTALRAETNFYNRFGEDETNAKHIYGQVITHEVAHTNTHKIVLGHYAPSWYFEGLAMIVAHQGIPIPQPGQTTLKEGLSQIKGPTPTDEDLKPLGKIPFVYSFAKEFMKWLFIHNNGMKSAYSVDEKPDNCIYNPERVSLFVKVAQLVGQGIPFETSFAQVFGVDFIDAYKQFFKELS